MSAARQKKGIFGRHRAKTGQRRLRCFSGDESRTKIAHRRWRMPAGSIGVNSRKRRVKIVAIPLGARQPDARLDVAHDFVIVALRRNKLKD
jgi:hypothetical protein